MAESKAPARRRVIRMRAQAWSLYARSAGAMGADACSNEARALLKEHR